MKKQILSVLFIACVLSIAGVAFGDADIQKNPSCKFCGMDRAHFAHSRMVVEYEDGTSLGTCSIHCMATELALNIDKTPKTLLVGDFNSKMLIDAEKAFWVIGGNKPGVMTKNAKWAFENKADAEKFIAANGGTLSTFDDAMKAAYEDMYADTKMIREKRKMMKK
ncbi:MAG: nitrous oxide reductase accessory protein NosL [Deltaproteobacteria bacterium]|nr:nitrous oxide reductase accessory protein NosL [Deltaproteobacteria bacterium]